VRDGVWSNPIRKYYEIRTIPSGTRDDQALKIQEMSSIGDSLGSEIVSFLESRNLNAESG
jgi:hypothetical protein